MIFSFQVEEKAVCADTARGATSRCNAVQCGDGRVQASNDGLVVEECDDGNEADGDGCSSSCVVESGFLCRNPKTADKTADRGPTVCRNVKCGDGFVDGSNDGSRIEECDDGNEADGDGCSAACVLEDGYICTTQNQEHGSEGILASERSSCTAVVCGDGYRKVRPGVAGSCFPLQALNSAATRTPQGRTRWRRRAGGICYCTANQS